MSADVWVIVDKTTGKAVRETRLLRNVDIARMYPGRFEVVPLLEWLQRVNTQAKAAQSE